MQRTLPVQLQRRDLGGGGVRLRTCAKQIRFRTVPRRIQLLSQLQGLSLAGRTLLDDRQALLQPSRFGIGLDHFSDQRHTHTPRLFLCRVEVGVGSAHPFTDTAEQIDFPGRT
ncbi:hypothetical protein D3C85_1456660 [compost metagenome]